LRPKRKKRMRLKELAMPSSMRVLLTMSLSKKTGMYHFLVFLRPRRLSQLPYSWGPAHSMTRTAAITAKTKRRAKELAIRNKLFSED
jgi:uncharacterized protein YqjF (DUF2071 family)